MKNWIGLWFGALAAMPLLGEVDNSRVLKDEEVKTLFSTEVKQALGIQFPIFRVYHYKDDTGMNYTVLTEDRYKKGDKDSRSTRIKAVQLQASPEGLKKVWEVNDFYLPKSESAETKIWFWTKYCTFSDIDYDGVVDPVLVYGTSGMNDLEDGRLKVIALYQGKKHVIRHQNSTLDGERHTQVDKAIYELPMVVRDHVIAQLKKIEAAEQSIFPTDWEDKMIRYQTQLKDE